MLSNKQKINTINNLPEYTEKIRKEIDDLRHRTNINPIEQSIKEYVIFILIIFRNKVESNELIWQHPNISTEGNGDICLEWINFNKHLFSIHIANTKQLEYLIAFGSSFNEMIDGPFHINDFLLIWKQWYIK